MVQSMLYRKNKGQTFMPDYLAGLLVFGVVVAIFLSSWNTIISNQTEFSSEEALRPQAIYSSTFLVSTEGYPQNWEEDSVEVTILGFAEDDHVLDQDKLREFRSFSYRKQSSLLQAPQYQMKVYNDTKNFELDGSELVFGQDYSDAEIIVPIERNIIYNKSGDIRNGKLRLVVWRG